MGRTRDYYCGARACVPPHTRARVRGPHRRQPRKRSRLSSQENQTRLFESLVAALDGRTAQRAGARGTMEAPFQPRRFAVKFNPPRFLLEYSDGGKKRVRSVRSHTFFPVASRAFKVPSLPPLLFLPHAHPPPLPTAGWNQRPGRHGRRHLSHGRHRHLPTAAG